MTRVLVVDDEVCYRALFVETLTAGGLEVAQAGSVEEALASLAASPAALVVSDVRMPGGDGLQLLRRTRERWPALPFLLVTAFPDVRGAVEALKLGAVDYLAKPVDLDELLAAVRDGLGLPATTIDREVPPAALAGIVAESPAMRAVLRDAALVATSDAPVLLGGESGTGKEVVARFIHRCSGRRDGPFVAVNCAAVTPGLLASELFGHEKGAFTGATERRAGRFREAARGTLLLDEVGDLPLDMQPVLLRALETGRVPPVGGDRDVAVDCRVIAATNRDLDALVEAGRFRLDLLHRLNVIHLVLPPLRERPEDVVPLARQALARDDPPKRLSRATQEALLAHGWPGNARELLNAVERARLLSRGHVLLPEHLPPTLRPAGGAAPAPEPEPAADPSPRTLEEAEAEALRGALAQTSGNRTRAAALLGISRRGLIYKLKRYGIS